VRRYPQAVLRKLRRNAGDDIDRLFIHGGFAIVAGARALLLPALFLAVGVWALLTRADVYLEQHQSNVNGVKPCPSSESHTKKTAASA
jgi:hypothetical protein